MDFICKGCGRYEYIPPEDADKREAIENLEMVLETFIAQPWQVAWLRHNEPELMKRFDDAVDKLLSRA
jgi:hypothetical protein